jgi:hypothetical protein
MLISASDRVLAAKRMAPLPGRCFQEALDQLQRLRRRFNHGRVACAVDHHNGRTRYALEGSSGPEPVKNLFHSIHLDRDQRGSDLDGLLFGTNDFDEFLCLSAHGVNRLPILL